MARIGPTFASELTAAGIPLTGISWDTGTGVIIACPPAYAAQVAAVLAAHDPTKQLPEPIVVYRSDLFRRCTDDEADKISAALEGTSSRMRNLFASVQTFRSDAPEWQLLHDTAVGLFGADRAAALLAPSV